MGIKKDHTQLHNPQIITKTHNRKLVKSIIEKISTILYLGDFVNLPIQKEE